MTDTQRRALQRAFVLHQRPYRESSLLIEAFAEPAGRVGLVARAARRTGSPLRGLLQPFVPLLLSWSSRHDLGTLTAAEGDGPPLALGGTALFSGLYMNELLVRLTHRHDPHPDLYDAYRRALVSLAARQPVEVVLRVFEMRLLQSVGYGLVLDRDVHTGDAILPDREYRYVIERGPVAADLAGEEGVPVRGGTLLALAAERLVGARDTREAKRLMRSALAPLLGGRPLASRALFRSQWRGGEAAGTSYRPIKNQ